jgi:hypothetical protein
MARTHAEAPPSKAAPGRSAPARAPGPEAAEADGRGASPAGYRHDVGSIPAHAPPASPLLLGEADDPAEASAHRVADALLAGRPASVQKEAGPASGGRGAAPASVHAALAAPGRPLDAGTRASFEPLLGRSLAGLRVHDDGLAAASAAAVGAHAYAAGRHVVLGAGPHRAGTQAGQWLLAHEVAHALQQDGRPAVVRRFPVTKVADVRSLEIERLETSAVPGNWSALGRRLGLRDKRIGEMLTMVNKGTAKHDALLRLQGRWGTLRSLLAPATATKAAFDPVKGPLPAAAALDAERKDEEKDRATLAGSNKAVDEAIGKFLDALKAYRDGRQELDEERVEFARFDKDFGSPSVQKILNAIPQVSFTPADVKALVGQESGDLTNVKVKGISPSKKGVQTKRDNPAFIGVGQHNEAARDEAIKWAGKQGVAIAAQPDPRHSAPTSILLTAAYLGRITTELLWPQLPGPKPSGDELKKLVFAAYNGGHKRVLDAANAVQSAKKGAKKGTAYTWSDLRGHARIRGETRDYVDRIARRLR